MVKPCSLQEEDTEALLAADFEIGHFFRERLIPRVQLYNSILESKWGMNEILGGVCCMQIDSCKPV